MKKMSKTRFYDTSSLLLRAENLFDTNESFVISSITLDELESIKTSQKKDADTKYAARRLLHLLDEYIGEYEIHVFNEKMLKPIEEKSLTINNDIRILATALDYNATQNEVLFITNDLSLYYMARLFVSED